MGSYHRLIDHTHHIVHQVDRASQCLRLGARTQPMTGYPLEAVQEAFYTALTTAIQTM